MTGRVSIEGALIRGDAFWKERWSMSEHVKKVSVTALKYHTHDGKAYDAGDSYQVEEALVGSLSAQGMAKLSDEVEQAEKDAKAAAKTAEHDAHKASKK